MDFSQVSVKFDLHLTVTIQPHELSFLLSVTGEYVQLGRVSQLLNWLTVPIYSNFSGASRQHCALRHRSQQLLCTMCRVSHTKSLVHLYPWYSSY